MNLLFPRDEEIVNVSLVTFLNALTMSCPHVKLDWEISRQWYNVKLGSAESTVKTDGAHVGEDQLISSTSSEPSHTF